MTEKDFSLGVPKPVKGRNVSGFDAAPPAASPTVERRQTRAAAKPEAPHTPRTPKRQRTSKKTLTADHAGATMVRVHTSLSVDTALALKEHSESMRLTQTEILAEALITHGETLAREHDRDVRSRYESLGFRSPRRKPRDGRMSATFYMSTVARRTLDDMATNAGYDGRSPFIDALIRRQLGLTE